MSLNRRYIAALILAAMPIALILLMSLSALETHAARTVFEYDDLGRLATVTNSGGAEAVYTYDKVGNIMYTDVSTPWKQGFVLSYQDLESPL